MKAIDLYSGVGGWSLGLAMAGIEVVRSYEWWDAANITNSRNNGHEAETVDVRNLSFSCLPNVDVVVGSPPCTHFSLANRGGKGDILEGLKDVERFLEIVEYLKPKFWAFENVPRLSSIMECELKQGGMLHRFSSLNPNMMVLDASEWGVPQRRHRLVVCNFDFDLMLSYRSAIPNLTLGDVVSALSSDPIRDPVYGTFSGSLSDHEFEDCLSSEEERINRELKTHHPIYNNMSFPDSLTKPARTITATCTRVSRESIVVPCKDGFRRLTLRERASIQSFPLGYQFYANTHSGKQKMIGNAIPPLLTYHIAHAMLGTAVKDLSKPSLSSFSPPKSSSATLPDRKSSRFPAKRKFRFAVPGLRFKSGVRFELSNSLPGEQWGLRFFYGDSKNVKEIKLGSALLDEIASADGMRKQIVRAEKKIAEVGGVWGCADSQALQKAWTHQSEDGLNPFDLLDSIGMAASCFLKVVPSDLAQRVVDGLMISRGNPGGHKKLSRHAPEVLSGLIVCSLVNNMFLEKPSFVES